ncbi:Protein SENESCENCE-ASSOCIATED GENE 21, mitochondrial [Linum grandiflorum]
MSRSFAAAELLSAAVSRAIRSRGFSSSAAAAARTVKKGGAVSVASMVKKTGDETPAGKQSWVPDPKTGFYRPDNVADEIDAAELRALLLKKH